MSESMKELIEKSIKSAGTSELEISTWVTDLKTYHRQETRQQQVRLEELKRVTGLHDQAVDNFIIAQNALKAEHQALARERSALAQERSELARERQAFAAERGQLSRVIASLEPGVVVYLLLAFLGAMLALLLLIGLQMLLPLVRERVGGLL